MTFNMHQRLLALFYLQSISIVLLCELVFQQSQVGCEVHSQATIEYMGEFNYHDSLFLSHKVEKGT